MDDRPLQPLNGGRGAAAPFIAYTDQPVTVTEFLKTASGSDTYQIFFYDPQIPFWVLPTAEGNQQVARQRVSFQVSSYRWRKGSASGR